MPSLPTSMRANDLDRCQSTITAPTAAGSTTRSRGIRWATITTVPISIPITGAIARRVPPYHVENVATAWPTSSASAVSSARACSSLSSRTSSATPRRRTTRTTGPSGEARNAASISDRRTIVRSPTRSPDASACTSPRVVAR